MPEALLELQEVEARYGQVKALHGVSLRVDEGEIVAVLGANGAGKTTTLRAVSGTVRRSGEITFAGKRISRHSPEAVARLGIAHVPEGRGTLTELTVRENLRLGAYPRRDRDEIKDDEERVFVDFPWLEERGGQRAGTLSGGEQQMLALARALMLRPRLVLLDEPSLGLDPKALKQVFENVVLMRDAGKTILLVEQNVRFGLRLATEGIVMESGRVMMTGRAGDVLNNPQMADLYFGGSVKKAPQDPVPSTP
jgi:branched-chain amino acid transport system ATP-binding protein